MIEPSEVIEPVADWLQPDAERIATQTAFLRQPITTERLERIKSLYGDAMSIPGQIVLELHGEIERLEIAQRLHGVNADGDGTETLAELERRAILARYARSDRHQGKTAKSLDMGVRTLRNKFDLYGIKSRYRLVLPQDCRLSQPLDELERRAA